MASGKRLAAGSVVPVELAARVDGDADRQVDADWLEVVPPVLGAEDEVAGAGVDRPGRALDVPVDLTLKHDPPLVVEMVVGVVRLPGRVADQERLDVVGEDDRLGPGGRRL